MAPRSIRGRLTVVILSSVLLLTVVAGFASWAIVCSRIVHEFERFLEAEARGLMVLTAREGERIEADFDEWRAETGQRPVSREGSGRRPG